MKRIVLVAVFILICSFSLFGQNTPPIDLILVLDTSSAMAASFDIVNNYLTGPFLSEFLRVGDTFHLIAYADSPRLEIARRVLGIGDLESIIGRMLIQYPVERGNNARAAIAFAENYAATLPNRPKKIVMIGIGGQEIVSLANAANQRLNAINTTFYFVPVTPGQPLANLPSSGRPRAPVRPPVVAVAPQPPRPPVQQPPPQQPAQPTPGQPVQQQPLPGQPTIQPLPPPITQIAEQPDIHHPAAPPIEEWHGEQFPADEDYDYTFVPETGDEPYVYLTETDVDTEPAEAEAAQDAAGIGQPIITDVPAARTERQRAQPDRLAASMPAIIGAIIGILLLLALIIFLISRRLGSSPNRVIASASAPPPRKEKDLSPFVDHSKELAKYAAGQAKQRTTPYTDKPVKQDFYKAPVIDPSGPLLLNLFVEEQNTAIGKRNIHSLKSGYSMTVGGSKSDDNLIFLVPFPSKIGEIRRNGSQCTFIPRKPKYFPDLGSNELRDCINKTIRIVSDKGYEVRFRFEMYEDPLIALNRVLYSIKVPG